MFHGVMNLRRENTSFDTFFSFQNIYQVIYLIPIKFFNNLERSNRPSELFRSFKVETTGVEKAFEPLGKLNKRLRAAFNLPKKNAAHPGSLMRGSGNRRQVGRIF